MYYRFAVFILFPGRLEIYDIQKLNQTGQYTRITQFFNKFFNKRVTYLDEMARTGNKYTPKLIQLKKENWRDARHLMRASITRTMHMRHLVCATSIQKFSARLARHLMRATFYARGILCV